MAKIAAMAAPGPAELLNQSNTDTFWRNQGVNYLSFMQDVACNIASQPGYYFYQRDRQRRSSAVWISNYLRRPGMAGNMVWAPVAT